MWADFHTQTQYKLVVTNSNISTGENKCQTGSGFGNFLVEK